MGIFDSVKGLFGQAQSKLPEDLNSVDELKAKAQNLAQDHGNTIDKVVDTVQDKLPGETGDKLVDGVQQKLDDFAGKK
jgi:hypothetical protein